ncbi:MAG: hypothetical protein ACRD2Z_02265 [Thermoanaerobaculia bacterium]
MDNELADLPLRHGETPRPEPNPGRQGGGAGASRPAAGETGPTAVASGVPAAASRGAGDRILAVLAVVAVSVGLIWGLRSSWMWRTPLWALFALGCVFAQLLTLLGSREGKAWKVAAVATAGLAGFWLLVVLPSIASNAGFLLTAGVAAAGGALWLAPGRPR